MRAQCAAGQKQGRQLHQLGSDGWVTRHALHEGFVPRCLLMASIDLIGQYLHAQRVLCIECW